MTCPTTTWTVFVLAVGLAASSAQAQLGLDLVPLTLTTTSNTLREGEQVSITFEVKQRGLVATSGACRIGFYLSKDSTISTTADQLWFTVPQPALGPGKTRKSTVKKTVPKFIDGACWLGIYVDDKFQVNEFLFENNNTMAIPVTCVMKGPTKVLPADHATAEGSSSSYYLGADSAGRQHHAEGDLRGTPVQITEVGYRLDYRSQSAANGRQWSRVTLKAAETDMFNLSRTFSKNYKTAPTEVFKGPVNWMIPSGNPPTKPAPWDVKLAFPFKTPWKYSGTWDLLLEYTFSGGKLGNGAKFYGKGFYLDAVSRQLHAGSPTYTLGSKSCRDSAMTSTAYMGTTTDTWAAVASPPHGNNVRFQIYSYRTAPNAPVLTVVGLGGNTAGVNIGAVCNKLYMDLGKPWVPIFRKTKPDGNSGTLVLYTPYQPALNGLVIWAQTAWDDSKTRYFSLTNASRIAIAKQPVVPLKLAIYASSETAATGAGPHNHAGHNPITRITHK